MSRRRLYPERPLVGVGILIKQGDKYLLIKRAAEPDRGLWSIPGGMVERGETVKEAAIREAFEETCLKVRIEEKLGVVDKIIHDEDGRVKYHFIIIDFLASPVEGVMMPRDDALDAKWVYPGEFKNYNLTPTLIDLLKRMNIY